MQTPLLNPELVERNGIPDLLSDCLVMRQQVQFCSSSSVLSETITLSGSMKGMGSIRSEAHITFVLKRLLSRIICELKEVRIPSKG